MAVLQECYSTKEKKKEKKRESWELGGGGGGGKQQTLTETRPSRYHQSDRYSSPGQDWSRKRHVLARHSLQGHQSKVIRNSSRGMGSNWSRSMPRDSSSDKHQSGTNCVLRSGLMESSESRIVSARIDDMANVYSPSFVKSKSLGKSRPLGIRTPSWRSSSKKG